MINPLENYPKWFVDCLAQDSIEWDANIISTMPRFLSEYSLHDSYWCGLLSIPNYRSMMVVQFDAFWSQGRIEHPGSSVNDWPLLLIQFERVWRVQNSFSSSFDIVETISTATSNLLNDEQKLALLDSLKSESQDYQRMILDDSLFRTQIDPIYGGFVDLIHGGETRFLMINAAGASVPIPDL